MAKSKQKAYRPKLYNSIFQVRFEHSLSFFRKFLDIGDEFKEFSEWEYNHLSLVLKDTKKHFSVRTEFNSFSYSQDSNDEASEDLYIDQIIQKIPKILDIKKFNRFGYKKSFLVKVDISFQELALILDTKLLNQDDKLVGLLPGKVNDIMYSVVLENTPYKCRVVAGPVTKDEVANNYIKIDDKHFSDFDDKLRQINSYPEVSIFLDVDFYQSGSMIISDLQEFRKASKELINRFVQDFTNYLLNYQID